MKFYLGAHHAHWLGLVDIPLFVSHRTLSSRRRLPRANTNWALDSGAFSDITINGCFTTTPADYVAAVRRYGDEIGHLDWAAPQDHMTEPWVLARSSIARTVTDAQTWTTRNLLDLRHLAADLAIIPVLQGQTLDDYHRHIDAYGAVGIDLEAEPVVGLGSVCRRQSTREICEIVTALADLPLHGFGVKTSGLDTYGWALRSADSMAWSYNGRRIRPCPQRPVLNCANCLHHALTWRRRVLAGTDRHTALQLTLF